MKINHHYRRLIVACKKIHKYKYGISTEVDLIFTYSWQNEKEIERGFIIECLHRIAKYSEGSARVMTCRYFELSLAAKKRIASSVSTYYKEYNIVRKKKEYAPLTVEKRYLSTVRAATLLSRRLDKTMDQHIRIVVDDYLTTNDGWPQLEKSKLPH